MRTASPAHLGPRLHRTAAGALGVLAVLLAVVVVPSSPAAAQSGGDGELQITPSPGNQVICELAHSGEEPDLHGGAPPGDTWWVGCYFDPSIPASRIQSVTVMFMKEGGCGSQNQVMEFYDFADAYRQGELHRPGDAGPNGAPLPPGALWGSVQWLQGTATCPVNIVGTVHSYMTLHTPSAFVFGTMNPDHYSFGFPSTSYCGSGRPHPHCYAGGATNIRATGPHWPGERYGDPVIGGDRGCENLLMYDGPEPDEVIADGTEVTLRFRWHMRLGQTRLHSVTFDPGDGGPPMTKSDPLWLGIDGDSGSVDFTFTKTGTGTLEGASLSCTDADGITIDYDYEDIGEPIIDPSLPDSDLSIGDCVEQLTDVGLNPASWVSALVRGVGCVITWALVPGDDDLGDFGDRVRDAFNDSGLSGITGSADAVLEAVGALDQGTGPCSGPTVDIEQLYLVNVQPFTACAGTSGGEFAPIVKGGLSALLVVGAAMAVVKMVAGAFGFRDVEPYWDWDGVNGSGNTAKVYDYT